MKWSRNQKNAGIVGVKELKWLKQNLENGNGFVVVVVGIRR